MSRKITVYLLPSDVRKLHDVDCLSMQVTVWRNGGVSFAPGVTEPEKAEAYVPISFVKEIFARMRAPGDFQTPDSWNGASIADVIEDELKKEGIF